MKKIDFSDISLKRWITGGIMVVLFLLVVLWTGNWWLLLLTPLVVDCYITNILPWDILKKDKDGKRRGGLWELLDTIIFALFWVYLIQLFLLQMYKIPTSSLEKSLLVGDHLMVSKVNYGPRMPNAPIYMPMTQNSLPFSNIKSYLEWPLWGYHRLAGLEKVERKDIVVFNFPCGDTVCINMQNPDYYQILLTEGANEVRKSRELIKGLTFHNSWERNHFLSDLGRKRVWAAKDALGGITWRPVDKRECYVKRCIGLPGDTVEIRHNVVYINGEVLEDEPGVQHNYYIKTSGVILNDRFFEQLGISNEDRQVGGVGPDYFLPLTKEKAEKVKNMPTIASIVIDEEERDSTGLSVFPFSQDYPWSRDNYGPIWMPTKGSTVTLDDKNIMLYERIITSYEGHTLDYKNGKIYVDGKETSEYTFAMDYYWMMGDNRHKSADSRYWGFVPEDHIVGKPLYVWLSLDPDKDFFGSIRWDRMFMPIK
ncbi:MAG: S26 family signal peptidase [Bacteroidales bacterium]|nr:S26 family signal peptidase [Bacteroidales bacterium]